METIKPSTVVKDQCNPISRSRESGHLNLRLAFILPCLLTLIIPVAGYLEIENTANLLRTILTQQTAQQLNASAEQISSNPMIIDELRYAERTDAPLFVLPANAKPDLDGRSNDWLDTTDLYFGVNELIELNRPYYPSTLQTRLKLMQTEQHLYAFFDVTDDAVVYREISNISIHRNDHIRIAMMDREGYFQRYTIAAEQPGVVYASVVSTGGRALRPEPRIEGYWRATSSGYQVELQIDRSLINQQFAFNVADVDDSLLREILFLQGSGCTDQPDGLSTLVSPSAPLGSLLEKTFLNRVRFVDRFDHVLVDLSDAMQTDAHATANQPSERLEKLVVANNIVLGTLSSTIDETPIVMYRNTHYRQLMVLSLAVFAFSLILCFLLSQGVLKRLNRLGELLENAVDDQGRVQNDSSAPPLSNLTESQGGDAISELSRKFVSITQRLHQYNDYLEQLSRRLAHELRTPVTVVRSSLENLEVSVDADSQKFVQRAKNGITRLTNILNSMSEATRIEQSLNKDEFVVFELTDVISGCVEGYEQAFSEQKFELMIETQQSKVSGIPDLFAQMLDKLIDNAVQFSQTDQPIVVRLTASEDFVILRISNSGPSLPSTMTDQLFDPMVSLRKQDKDGSSHLGLGLYVAKLIAEFHGGEISLKNREDRQGAVVTIRLPLMRLSSKLA